MSKHEKTLAFARAMAATGQCYITEDKLTADQCRRVLERAAEQGDDLLCGQAYRALRGHDDAARAVVAHINARLATLHTEATP